MADHPAPWLDEILRTAGDISPASASEIQHAAEYAHQVWVEGWGEAWGEYAARQAAKGVLAGVATDSDPAVQAAHRASREAREHADRLFADTAGPGSNADLDTPEGLAFYLADHAAAELYAEYSDAYGAASERYHAEVDQAWRKADMNFLRSHHAELEVADPAGLKDILGGLTEDFSPSAGRAPALRPTGPSETRARHAQVTANSSDKTNGAGNPQTHSSLDFPTSVVPGTEARLQAAMAGEWQHLRHDHRADPAAVARDAPEPEMAGFIHDAAHMYPGAPWGEVVVRGQGEGWWQTRDWEREPQPNEDPAEWKAFFRQVLGRDMPLNAEHEARLKQLDAADLLTRDMWTNGPDGTSYLHGFDAAALASERGGLSFPHLYQQRYLQLSAAGQPLQGALEETPGPKVSKAADAATEVRAAAADFPYPPLSAAPETTAAIARGTASSRAGRQVPPRTRGRVQ